MNELERKIAVLKMEKEQLQGDITLLQRDNDALRRDKKALKTLIKKNKMMIFEYIRQGFRYEYNQFNSDWGYHYLVLPVEGIPLSLAISDVKQLVDETLKPYLDDGGVYEGYTIMHFDYSARKKIWYVQIEKKIDTLKQG